MTGIVQKCIAAPKTKTKELSVQVALMYVEIEKQEAVVEELVKGMEAKNPKIVSACVAATTLALREFGHKVIGVKPLIKKLAPLMSDRDKAVRDEGKQLAVEIYRWIGAAMKPQISTLPQVTLKELEDEFEKLKGERAEPSRYLKSQQEKQAKIADAAAVEDAYNGKDSTLLYVFVLFILTHIFLQKKTAMLGLKKSIPLIFSIPLTYSPKCPRIFTTS